MRRAVAAGALVVLAVGALWYLRDPAWLIDQTTGLRAPERAADGTVYRWSGGHASFFVPSDAHDAPHSALDDVRRREPAAIEPMMVTFTIDDERAGRILLTGPEWQEVALPMPPPGSRRVRRIDVGPASRARATGGSRGYGG